MLRLENINVYFDEFHALKNTSCQINYKDFILILGHNGSGKSTLFNLISGKIQPQSGNIFLDNENITSHSEQKRAQYVSRVFQNTTTGSVGPLTLLENLSLAMLKGKRAGFQLAKNNFPAYVVEEILKPLQLNLENQLHTPMEKLSGGQRQIITIIMATLRNPAILLLDEPTAALDPESSEKLLNFVHNYTKNKEMATLMVTHDEKDAEFLCNKKWVMKGGVLSL